MSRTSVSTGEAPANEQCDGCGRGCCLAAPSCELGAAIAAERLEELKVARGAGCASGCGDVHGAEGVFVRGDACGSARGAHVGSKCDGGESAGSFDQLSLF